MCVSFMASICYVRALEYRMVRKRWRRLNPDQAQAVPAPSSDDKEIERIEEAVSTAHLPDSDSTSTYYSAFEVDIDRDQE